MLHNAIKMGLGKKNNDLKLVTNDFVTVKKNTPFRFIYDIGNKILYNFSAFYTFFCFNCNDLLMTGCSFKCQI